MSAGSGIANSRTNNPPSLVQTERKAKADPLSPENMDPWVYQYTKENIDPYTQWHLEDNINQLQKEKWSLSQQKKPHHHHKRPDVAERNMDEEVHGFVADSLPPLTEWEHTRQPFIPNGSDASAFEGAAFNQKKHHHKHHKRDIGERGYDEEVQQFVKEYIPPLNTRVRSTLPFVPNGSDPSAHEGAAFNQRKHHKNHNRKHHKKPDVAERAMNEEVYGFTDDNVSPDNEMQHSKSAPAVNGGKTKRNALTQ